MSIKYINGIRIPALSTYAHYKCNDDAANTTVTDDGACPYASGSHICIGTIPAFIVRAARISTSAILSKSPN